MGSGSRRTNSQSLGVALRVFLLVSPPFVPHAEQDDWLLRSIDVAFAAGASAISLIPTRTGNGALEALADDGMVSPAAAVATSSGASRSRMRTRPAAARASSPISGTWIDSRPVAHCLDARRARLHAMNLEQRVLPQTACPQCQEQVAV